MARPQVIAPDVALANWNREVRRLGYPPSGKQFAQHLGVSERTVWRLMPFLLGRKSIGMCPRCHGRGYVLRRARVA